MVEKLGITPGPWGIVGTKVTGKKVNIVSRLVKGERYTDLFEATFGSFGRKEDLQLVATAPELLENDIDNAKDAETIINCIDKGEYESIRHFALAILGRSKVGQTHATGLPYQEIKRRITNV